MRLSRAEAAVEALQQRNAIAEVGQRNTRLDKREKDKHAGDLFEIEKGLEDVLDLAIMANPDIAAKLRQTALQEDDQMETGALLGHVSV